jgi:hypothetical protein
MVDNLPYGRDCGEGAIKIWLGQSAMMFLLYWIGLPGHADHKVEDKNIDEMVRESGFLKKKNENLVKKQMRLCR